MKRLMMVLLATVIAVSLVAEEPKKNDERTAHRDAAAPTAAAHDETQPVDSPLVAAAKRSNRARSKARVVITNENLIKSGENARVTTTTNQHSLKMPEKVAPPRPTPEMEAAAKREDARTRKAAEAEAATKAEEARLQRLAAAAARAEEGYYDELEMDPAEAEQKLREAASAADTPPGE